MYTSIPAALMEILLVIGVSGALGYLIGRTRKTEQVAVVEEIPQTEKCEPLVGIDDLKLIHGIDAPMEQVLLKGSIDSYEALARATPARLKKILEAGGSQFFAIDTTSWPHQAALANQDRWMDLKKYQAKLKKTRK